MQDNDDESTVKFTSSASSCFIDFADDSAEWGHLMEKFAGLQSFIKRKFKSKAVLYAKNSRKRKKGNNPRRNTLQLRQLRSTSMNQNSSGRRRLLTEKSLLYLQLRQIAVTVEQQLLLKVGVNGDKIDSVAKLHDEYMALGLSSEASEQYDAILGLLVPEPCSVIQKSIRDCRLIRHAKKKG